MSDTCLQAGDTGATRCSSLNIYSLHSLLHFADFCVAVAFFGLWLQVVCLTKIKKKKITQHAIPSPLATIFDTLHGNRSNQVKL